jgi:trehalose-6-phosphate hydrolase
MKMDLKGYALLLLICWLPALASAQVKAAATDKRWWKESVIYQIYMPSFADSNGDGFGDLKGITGKLDYLQNLGIKAVLLSPFLQSPRVDNGYDVSSYYEIDIGYGKLDDFKNYLAAAHKRGIKVIMDLPLNQTSIESAWFQESRKSLDNPYRDYYIWKDRPNNWESFYGGSAWQKDSITNQYYLHKFDSRMPDLNWANPKVAEEIYKVLRFWLGLGVDGFRLDAINFLTTDGIIHDNPLRGGAQQHYYDINQPHVKDAIKKIKSVANEFSDRFILGEVGSEKIESIKDYEFPELLDVGFQYNLAPNAPFSAERLFNELRATGETIHSFPALFYGSANIPRLMDRLAGGDKERAAALAALMLTAKGLPLIYYGEEIGMQNIVPETMEELQDVQGKTHYQLALKKRKAPSEAFAEAKAI